MVNYTKAGTIASYLELMEVDAVYLPVPVNFIFIGFDGKGNQGEYFLCLFILFFEIWSHHLIFYFISRLQTPS